MNIRTSTSRDVESIVALFTASVHLLAARNYTPEQLTAWAPKSPDLEQWSTKLSTLETLVAEFDGTMVGFITYTDNGHIVFLYTSPTFSRKGVASQLYEITSRVLLANGVCSLSTEASIEARPFFESKGFNVVEEQVVERNGMLLKRFAMAGVLASVEA
ncbi:GNAT family N-acetyltransferase [Paraperlucidibaca wandonensis]|jgi:putative acetyltransferase|uniref:GNAT family N-acetyltransferase n=1 Tax=Paraperlucidibaca wandonensis TaxID=1268273 RepID=A0ABW3HCH8_9GAMM